MQINRQKKIAVINDFSGFGRCSIAVALPIISAMKIQCCPLPTAIFSNHTGYPDFYVADFTEHMIEYASQWKKLNLHFDGIATGFLGSEKQIEIVSEFINMFGTDETVIIVDPVMGDYGRLYPTYSEKLAGRMKELVHNADILTPNLTEACILTGSTYRQDVDEKDMEKMCDQLCQSGPDKIVISGLDYGNSLGNFIYQKGKESKLMLFPKIGEFRSGTGDVFSSIIAADAVNGVNFEQSVEKASGFIIKALKYTNALGIPKTDGICIEEYLSELAE